jgi:hypothetical protein
LELKKPPQLGYGLRFDSATKDEYCGCPSRQTLNPESHRVSHIAGAAPLCRIAFHPRTDHE